MANQDKGLFASLTSFGDFKYWLRHHKLEALGGAWLSAVVGTLAAQYSQPTPVTLKLFQTRIYAQAFTLVALCGAAAITMSDDRKEAEENDDILPGKRI